MKIWKRKTELDEYHRDKDGYMRGNRPCTKLLVHYVFTFKYRRNLSNYKWLPESIKYYIKEVCNNKNWYVGELSVEKDHIHLLVQIPPKISVSYVAQIVKGNVSRFIRLEFPELIEDLNKRSLFGRKYFAKTVGDSDFETTKRYIEGQGVTTPYPLSGARKRPRL